MTINMGGERDTSRPTDGSDASTKKKPHTHSSKSQSHSRSRNEKKDSKKRKRRHRSSSTSSSELTSSSISTSSSRSHSPASKKHKKCKDKKTKRHSCHGEKHKKKKKKHHHHHHHHHHRHKKVKDADPQTTKACTAEEGPVIGPAMPENSGSTNGSKDPEAGVTRTLTPMTKEEWDKKQSEVRRVYDTETGRHRLVRGEGEIIEEIVSRDRHKQINKQATQGDGLFYQQKAGLAKQH